MERRLRLKRTRDFQRLRREGRVFRHPAVIMSYAPNNLSHNRYGFITSKHLGEAVERNRIRRLLREAVRHCHPDLKSGFDIVFIGRTSIIGQPFSTINRIVYQLIQRAGLWRIESSGSES